MDFNVDKYLSNLSYINKDFQSLWNDILETVPKMTSKWLPSESNESDPLVVLLKELAIFADKLNYNIDKNILEQFPATLTQLHNAYNVYESLGYAPDWYISATTTVRLVYSGMVGDNTASGDAKGAEIKIPKFTAVSDDDSETVYTLLQDATFAAGTPSTVIVPAVEGTFNILEVNGSTKITSRNLDEQNRIHFNQTNIAQNAIIIDNNEDFSNFSATALLNGNVVSGWRRVDNLNQYVAGEYIYKLGIDPVNNSVYVQFPDDIGTLIGDGLYIGYVLSAGEQGNIGRGDITKFLNSLSATIGEDEVTLDGNFVVSNETSTQNGRDPLDIAEMRKQFGKIAGTFNTLVTLRDYENYIYEYEDIQGQHAVSNLRVSDRNNDLYTSTKYVSMDNTGSFDENIYRVTGSDSGAMTAYDLRLYPLSPATTALDSKEVFNNTFNIDASGNLTTIDDLDKNIQDNVLLDDVKCINHDFKAPGYPVLVEYDLKGQIYLQSIVSQVEANEILNTVTLELYESLYPRNLEWGKPVDYGTVIDTIKNSDGRIQYVALDAINYINVLNDPYASTADKIKLDATARAILAGNMTWTEYSPFIYNYNQNPTNTNYIGVDTGEESGETQVGQITGVQTYLNISNASNAEAYIVGPNETITILKPQYNPKTQYGNYLYFIAIAQSEIEIPANTPYVLGDNEYIYIFEDRDSAEAFLKGDTNAASYTLEKGEIVQTSVDVTRYKDIASATYENMGSSITITTMEKAEGYLQSSSTLAGTGSSKLYLATNSEGLQTAFKAVNTKYTLMSGEYLFYTDSLSIELGIIGEGTTLWVEDASIEDLHMIETDSDLASLLNGSASTSITSTWTEVDESKNPRARVCYALNELYTFGENYVIVATGGEGTGEAVTNLLGKLVDTNNKTKSTFSTLEGITNIYYALSRDNNYGNLTYSSLSALLSGDSYEGLVRMALVTGPGVEQTLTSTGSSSNIKNPIGNTADLVSPTVTQHVVFDTYKDETSTESKDISGKSLQTSLLLTYQGGNKLQFVGDERNTQVYVYEDSGSGAVTSSSSFVEVSKIKNENKQIVVPGVVPGTDGDPVGDCAVFAAYNSDNPNSISYFIAKAGTSYDVGEETAEITPIESGAGFDFISIPKVASLNANCYVLADSTSKWTSMTLKGYMGDAATKSLNNIFANISGFSPLYVPEANETLADANTPSSCFDENHPYNYYALPKLRNINITISPSSIQS